MSKKHFIENTIQNDKESLLKVWTQLEETISSKFVIKQIKYKEK